MTFVVSKAKRVTTPVTSARKNRAVFFPSMSGFTLLELIVAIAIFALLSVMAYSGLIVMLQTADQTEQQAQRMTELQMAMIIISRDLFQATGRKITNEYEAEEAALLGTDKSLNLTRAGWSNLVPDDRVRSTLQRVRYSLDEGELVRTQWFVLDRVSSTEGYAAPLLKKVSGLTFRYMNEGRSWESHWSSPVIPPPSPAGTPAPVRPLPLAVEITLELEDWGAITRMFKLPRGWS